MSISSKILKNKSDENEFYIYKLLDERENILYIGKTNNLSRRISEHQKEKEWFSQVIFLEFHETPDAFISDIYEIYLIGKEKPLYNLDCNHAEIISPFNQELSELSFDRKFIYDFLRNNNPNSPWHLFQKRKNNLDIIKDNSRRED